MSDNAKPGNGAPETGAKRWKKATAITGTATALVGLATAIVQYTQAGTRSAAPAIAITSPGTGAGATASACQTVLGMAKVADGMTLIVAVRRTTGTPRSKTKFYRVDTARSSGRWNVTVSLEGENPNTAGQWYSITAFTMPVGWADFLEKVGGSADGPLITASTMPPYDGEAPSIDVQRVAGQGFC
ncbi:hypothetical protein ABZ897_13395 [Nonomuraea sp. NPDC046802]|uniref:hypothetical protein n=1 Tax=Nonomuraea sp. NPDC046802 TaxID=3154919 RepID=UPI0033CCAFAE